MNKMLKNELKQLKKMNVKIATNQQPKKPQKINNSFH